MLIPIVFSLAQGDLCVRGSTCFGFSRIFLLLGVLLNIAAESSSQVGILVFGVFFTLCYAAEQA
jgi:hypothetical protein